MNTDFLLNKILVIPAILVAFTFKGWIQAKMAIKLGDDTPKYYGRDTFNPLKHIDIIGFIFMLIMGFGWTKPIEIDERNFKNYYKDDLKIRLAGIGANLLVGFVATLAWIIFYFSTNGTNVNIIISNILLNIALLNCTWFILNLLPIPGFDGFKIIVDILGNKSRSFESIMYRYNMVIFLVLILPVLGSNSILDIVVGVPGRMLFGLFCNVAFMLL